MRGIPVDISGRRYGRLVAIERLGFRKGEALWKCLCDCGTSRIVPLRCLRGGISSSCGCHRRDRMKALAFRHGETGTPTHRSWSSMKQRCTNPAVISWKYYGAKGIRVCNRWNVFANFLADMGERPPGTSLERLDNTRDYCPENCVWATPQQQCRNKRTNRLVTYDGQTKPLAQWADEVGINRKALAARLKRGWTLEKAFTSPI